MEDNGCTGAGTSSEEGVGLCFGICEHLLQKKVCSVCDVIGLAYNCLPFLFYPYKAFTFFATHFMELTNLETLYPNVEKLVFKILYINNNNNKINIITLFYSFHFEVKVMMIC